MAWNLIKKKVKNGAKIDKKNGKKLRWNWLKKSLR